MDGHGLGGGGPASPQQAAAGGDEDDEGVLWEGSPLYEHLRGHGALGGAVGEARQRSGAAGDGGASAPPSRELRWRRRAPPPATSRGLCATFPKHRAAMAQLEVEVARRVLESELLVQEDEDFVSNFVLTEEAIELARRGQEELENSSSSGLSEVLLLSGSLAAAAATVMYLSERTRLAATVASVLPTAIAAVSTAKTWSSGGLKDRELEVAKMEKEEFEKLVDVLLGDMKHFKQLVRKSLNLLQGMELMQSGFVFGVNANTGAPVTKSNGSGAQASSGEPPEEPSRLSRVLENRTCFPALRKASYQATVDLLRAYRQSVAKLMEVAPLEDHVDLKDHYLAFVDLNEFGIDEADLQDSAEISLKELKDTVQLSLLQQSEYLRRFTLSFSDRVRDHDNQQQMDKAGLLKQVRDLVGTLKKINSKLSKVFDYHQAMGLLPEPRKQRSLMLNKRHQTIDLIPLRSVYTSLFSTGLHLQNSLLKVRQLEKAFDSLEKGKKTKQSSPADVLSSLVPPEESLADWLASFDVIQKELNACVGCLDEGMSSIEMLKRPTSASPTRTRSSADDSSSLSSLSSPSPDAIAEKKVVTLSEGTSMQHEDEVYEAVIRSDESDDGRKRSTRDAGEQTDDEAGDAEKARLRMQTEQSERMLRELRQVLAVKARQREEREQAALAKTRAAAGQDEEAESKHNCQNGSVKVGVCDDDDGRRDEAQVKPRKPPRTRNGDCKSSSYAFHLPSSKDGRTNGNDADEEAALLSPKDHNEFGSQLSNDFEDSFDDYLRSHGDRVPSDEDGESQSSSSSEQDTVKSVSSGKECVKQSSSSYSDSEEEDRSQNSSVKKKRSKLRSTPSLDSLRNLKIQEMKFGKSKEARPPSDDCHSLSELRSISSPDIKKLVSQDSAGGGAFSSPYESLEVLPPRLRVAAALSTSSRRQAAGLNESLSESDSDTGEEEEGKGSRRKHKVLTTYRRPLRPAASVNRRADAARRRRARQAKDEKEAWEKDVGDPSLVPSSTYAAKNHRKEEPLFVPPRRPFGFGASVALEAARKAVSGGFNGLQAAKAGRGEAQKKEEVFGDSASE